MEYRLCTKKDLANKTIELKPGNFILTHGDDLFDKLIQIFTMSEWNHTALITAADGTITELTSSGIQKNNIAKYHLQEIYIVDIAMDEKDRKQIIDFAEVMLKRHDTYGFLTIASIAFKIITKSRFIIKLDGTLICSEFVARALSQGGIIWETDPSLITPADLYNRFVQRKKRKDKEIVQVNL